MNEIDVLIKDGAIFYVSHSGGKDSQAQFLTLVEKVPYCQLVIIHAHLPEVEWAGTREHIKTTIGDFRYIEVQAKKTFFEMVDHRQKWPAPAYRQCTSDLKRGPIEKAIRSDLKALGKTLGVNCIGLRAEESNSRAKKSVLTLNNRLSKAGRQVYDYLPVHTLKEQEIYNVIALAGQKPHWAYAEGMERLSCCFCIMGSVNDLQVAARCNPELYERYVRKERELNFTVRMGKTLEDVTGIHIKEGIKCMD